MSRAPAADRVLAVLTMLARHPEPLAAGMIAATLGLPRSTTYRLLDALQERGFVAYLPDRRQYGLGVAVYELGSAYQRQTPLQRIARPILHRLVDETTQNAHLAVLHGRDVYYVIEDRAPGRALLITDVGVRLPATVTASGLAMLSRLSSRQLSALYPASDALVQRDGRGPATVSELRRILTDVRRRGHAWEEDLVTVGLSSVAQAVVDHVGHPVAGVAVTYTAAEVDEAEQRDLVRAVNRTADLLGRRLGGGGARR